MLSVRKGIPRSLRPRGSGAETGICSARRWIVCIPGLHGAISNCDFETFTASVKTKHNWKVNRLSEWLASSQPGHARVPRSFDVDGSPAGHGCLDANLASGFAVIRREDGNSTDETLGRARYPVTL